MYDKDRSYTTYDNLIRHFRASYPGSQPSSKRPDLQEPAPEQRPPRFAKRTRVDIGPFTEYDVLDLEARARHDAAQVNNRHTTA